MSPRHPLLGAEGVSPTLAQMRRRELDPTEERGNYPRMPVDVW